jgi:hypothetical protein
MSKNKPTPSGRAKKKAEVSLVRSSAAEYLTFVAAGGDSDASVEMRYEDENVWLTQKMIAALYDVSVPAINQYLKRLFSDNELDPGATIKKYLIVQTEGDRQVELSVEHNSLQSKSLPRVRLSRTPKIPSNQHIPRRHTHFSFRTKDPNRPRTLMDHAGKVSAKAKANLLCSQWM